ADHVRDLLIAWAHGRRFAGLLLIMAMCATATAIAAWLVRRYSPPASGSGIPHVEAVLNGELPQAPFLLIPVKCIGGVLALVGALAAADRSRRWPVELRAAAVGAQVGLLAWFAPRIVGGGDPITQRALDGIDALGIVSLVLIIRFGLGAISYAAQTPGGLFAP